jgi:hypothetical protein
MRRKDRKIRMKMGVLIGELSESASPKQIYMEYEGILSRKVCIYLLTEYIQSYILCIYSKLKVYN